ncbi:DUF1573 domain-containing protein [Sinomicrobium sp. M5D2P17]
MKKHKSYKKRHIRLIILYLLTLLVFFACNQQVKRNQMTLKKNESTLTEVEIPKKLIHLGKIKRYDSITVPFKIINTGKIPLLIKKIETDCHCTKVEWKNKSVASQDSTTIRINYDSSQLGYFMQKVTVYSNTKNSPELLVFRGEVTE